MLLVIFNFYSFYYTEISFIHTFQYSSQSYDVNIKRAILKNICLQSSALVTYSIVRKIVKRKNRVFCNARIILVKLNY